MNGYNKLISEFVILSMILSVVLGLFVVLLDTSEGSGFRMDADLKDAHASFWGEDANDYSGYSVSGAGDVNGDGYDDILIGAYADEDGGAAAGQTYLILGQQSGWSMDMDLSNADASFWGEDANDYSGYSVSAAGDINGDGYDDFLIGAYGDDDGGDYAGQTYLILGKSSGWSMDTDLSSADASFWGEDDNDYSGVCVSAAGDVNGDGYDDILIGAYEDEDGGASAGQTYLIFGKTSGWSMDTDLSNADASFWGEDIGDNSGHSVAGAGDVNGDGYDDILIGAYNDEDGGAGAGQTYLVLGKASGWSMDTDLSNADASFWGEDASDYSGYSVSGAGDVNGDGYDDILIGAYEDEDAGFSAGQTYLILGKASGWRMDTDLSSADASFWGEDGFDNSGYSVAGAGDVNGDGYDDMLIGAYGDEDGGGAAGQTYLILGKPSGWSMDTDLSGSGASFWGEDAGDKSAYSVAGAGDVNGDGFDDILIGAYTDEDGGVNAGQTYMIFYENKPSVPKNLEAQLSVDGSKITLNWNTSAYWKSLTGYNIYRSDDGILYSFYATVNGTTLSYIDNYVTIGKTYRYRITSTAYPEIESSYSNSVEIQNDLDTDMDSFGNILDWDDDGDNVSDHNDAFPLDSSEWLDSDQDGVGNELDTDDDNDGIPDVSDIYPLNPLNDLSSTIAYMNSSLISMKSNLASLQNDIDQMETSLTILINGLSSDIDSLETDIDSLSLKIDELSDDLHDLDSSLHSEISALEMDLSTFESETRISLLDIINRLNNLDTDISSEIKMLNNTINNLESKSLNEIKQQITEVRNAISKLNGSGGDGGSIGNLSSVLTKLSEIESGVNDIYTVLNLRFDNITTQLKDLDKIETLASNIETIEELMEEIQEDQENLNKKQDETNDSVGALSSGVWVAVVLLIIVILLLLIMLARGGKRREEVVMEPEEPKEDLDIITISKSKSKSKSKVKGKKKTD
jgi:peptidoglycan hydrolase CwlO-like protein